MNTNSSKAVILELTNNQALHLWSILATIGHDTTNELKRANIFTKKGEQNKLRKHLSPLQQEQVDAITLSQLICDYLENVVDFSPPLIEERLK